MLSAPVDAAAPAAVAPTPLFANLTGWFGSCAGDAEGARYARLWVLHGGAQQLALEDGLAETILFSHNAADPDTKRAQAAKFIVYHPRWIEESVRAGVRLPDLQRFILQPEEVTPTQVARFFAHRPKQSFQAGVARVLPVQYRGNDVNAQFSPTVQAAEDALHAAQSARVGEADDEEAGTARKRRRRRQSTTTAKAATEDLVPGAEPLAPPAARLDRYYAPTPRFSSTTATGAAGAGASSAAAATFSAPLSSPEIDLAVATGRHIVAPSVALDSSAPLQHAKSAAELAAEQEQAALAAAAAAAAAEASKPKGRKRGRPAAAAMPPDIVAQQADAIAAAPAVADDDGLILPNPAAPDADFFRLHWQRLRAPRSIVAMFPFVDPTASQVVHFGTLAEDGAGVVPAAAAAAATTTTKVVEARPAKGRRDVGAAAIPSPTAAVTAAAADALTPRKRGRPSKAALQQQPQEQASASAPSAAAAPVARAKPAPAAKIKPAAKRAKGTSAASSVAPAAAPAAPAAAATSSTRSFTSDEIERAEETIALSSRSSLRSLAALVGQPVAEDEAAFAAQRTNRAWLEQMKLKLLLYQRGGK